LEIVPGEGFHKCRGLAWNVRGKSTGDDEALAAVTWGSRRLKTLTAMKALSFDPAVHNV
jgi:hypothetical protein